MTTVEAFAPAKINVSLHVTGQRDDGYHLIDSLVVFADIGDTIVARPSDRLSLVCEGPFGDRLPCGPDNLVLQAARMLDPTRGAEITLIKHLPPASGIGGGSADAAATLRALSDLWDVPVPPTHAIAALGADVPVCMASALTRMRGIGDQLTMMGPTPPMHVLLVNPGIEVSTPAVFATLDRKTNPAMSDPPIAGTAAWWSWLEDQRNDLQPPATAMHPEIGEVIDVLRGLPDCRLARMSGSGATCFALFDSGALPDTAALRHDHPGWWIAGGASWPQVFS